MNKQKKGFTLVELIVVITILAILGTIAILAFSGYSKNARDSARIADVGNMKKSLELWILQSGTYPEPSSGTGVTYSGGIVWNQGTFGESVVNTVGKIEKKPVDPLYDVEYTYSVTSSKKEYEIGAVLEKDMAFINSKTGLENVIPQANAAGTTNGEAYVSGTYNGILTTVGVNPTYILALPSIILSDLSDAELQGTTSYLVYEGKSNLPESYKQKSLTMTGTEFTFNPTVVWSGSSLTSLNNQTEFQNLVSNLQTAYKSDSNFSSLPEYASIVGTDTLSTEVMTFAKNLLEVNTSQELTNIELTPNFSCATNPGYANTNYTEGNPTQINQVWQNINAANPCYYACSGGYTGNDCSQASFSATGGAVTTYSSGGINYKVHTFTSVGTTNFTIVSGTGLVDYLVVAGGGAGLVAGGGAGGFKTGTGYLVQSGEQITVTVGNGGAVALSNGGDSVFGTVTSHGGGYGSPGNSWGASGGSGGGGYYIYTIGAGISGEGKNGGFGYSSGGSGGGGGGAGQDGGSTGGYYISGKGGDGLPSGISGVNTYYAGGGSGYGNQGPGYQVGGLGGGGHGGGYGGDTSMTAGAPNTGGGGGYYKEGGSGIVIVRYQIP